MATGTKTANVMDIPLSVSSVVAPYLGDNGYKMEGADNIRVLSVANGTLGNYNEGSATAPFGANPTLVAPAEQVLTLDYNKSMWLRIQKSQIQDIPISQFAKQVALQQADQVFIPAHDAYSIAKILAARPVANIQTFGTGDDIKLAFRRFISKARKGGADIANMIAWLAYDFADQLSAAINFTGSDEGYAEGKSGYLGKHRGVKCVETPDEYLGDGVYALGVDKRAVVNVTPKMSPKEGEGVTIIEKVPGFSGIEIQLRDRSGTFVLNKKVTAVASLEAESESL